MTNRIDILKIGAVAAAIGIVFYYLAHRGDRHILGGAIRCSI
jgi:hypothetical protein